MSMRRRAAAVAVWPLLLAIDCLVAWATGGGWKASRKQSRDAVALLWG